MHEAVGSNGSAALALVEPITPLELSVGVLMRRATDVAGVCREIVLRTAQAIPGSDRKHVKVEGWESIAAAYGYAAGSGDVEPEMREGKLVGFKAKGFLRRLSDGVVIAEAEGFVGEDEPLWAGGGHNKKTGKPYDRRPEYARRAMAQTRAISRVCRGAFAFVVTLIDSGLSTTPAEEMDGVVVEGSITPPRPVNAPSPASGSAALNAKPNPPHEPRASSIVAGHDRSLEYPFGTCKGLPISDPRVDDKSITFWLTKAQGELSDPSKAKWHDRAAKTVATLQAEQAYRAAVAREQSAPPESRGGQHSAPAPYSSDGADEPPPLDDDDAPPF